MRPAPCRYEREKDNLDGDEMADDEVRDVLAGKFDGLADAFKKVSRWGLVRARVRSKAARLL